jgi:citrate lyase subunit beta/citryl-CoA lyase
MSTPMRPYRSLLFVPGHRSEWADKAVRSGADAVILDLEDSVPDEEKESARATVADTIRRLRDRESSVHIGVRVHGLATRLAGGDLEAVVVPGLDVLFLPKIEHPTDVLRYDALVDHFETRNGVHGLRYVVPIETAPAVLACTDIAVASSRVGALVGPTAEHADITREIGFEWTPGGLETLYLRSRVLLACRAAGVHAVTGLWERIDDLDGLATFADSSRGLGFRGMVVIHPSHVPVVNDAFTADAADVDFYRGMVAAYEAATAEGRGAVRYRGRHIDRAHYDTARQWLRSAWIGARS